ncbi:MAG: hypothetical protein QOH16_3864 [Gaiellaceae bacterium]|nr:hypothetical protein [Gaiellaceae bacterium]
MADEDVAQPADADASATPESEPLPTESDVALENYREYGESSDGDTQ